MASTDEVRGNSDPILVGVDGSPSSRAALAWGARQAKLTNRPLLVVTVWHFRNSYGWPGPKAMLEETVQEVLGANPDIDLTTTVREGHPAAVLTEQSKTASLVVVGCRGRGEFAGMLLGSVSEFLTTHAHCPVVVIRNVAEVRAVDHVLS
jgi:nucleotide-binding universal stress UspA family protein